MKTPGLWPRMACWLYEIMPLFGLGIFFTAIYMGVGFKIGQLFGMSNQVSDQQYNSIGIFVFLFIVWGVYFVWFWAKGQTLPMKTWRIRIVDSHGNSISQGKALLRYCLSWVWFIPPLLVWKLWHLKLGESPAIVAGWVVIWALLSRLNPQRQFWHDVLSGTRLVYSPPSGGKIPTPP